MLFLRNASHQRRTSARPVAVVRLLGLTTQGLWHKKAFLFSGVEETALAPAFFSQGAARQRRLQRSDPMVSKSLRMAIEGESMHGRPGLERGPCLRILMITVTAWALLGAITGAQSPEGFFQDPDALGPMDGPGDKTVVHVYFGDSSSRFLTAEKRVIPGFEEPVETGKRILAELIQGPRSGLDRTLGPDTRLRALFLTAEGTAYVDLSPAVSQQHPGGCREELLTIYSIVNSLVLNIEPVKRVKLLIDGQEAQTLAGHIDLRYRFKADMLLIR
jgi:hypothetical protein